MPAATSAGAQAGAGAAGYHGHLQLVAQAQYFLHLPYAVRQGHQQPPAGLGIEDHDVGHHSLLHAAALLHPLQAHVAEVLRRDVAELV